MRTGNRLSLLHIPVLLSVMSLSTLLLSPATQSLLVAEKTATVHQSVKMTRPSLEPIAVVGPCDLNISISRDRSPSASPAADSDIPTCTSPPKSPPSEPLSHPLPKCTSSPSRKRQPSRRQSSISYLPADSPRLWTPRTPQTGSDFLERSPSLAGKNEGHVRARSQVIPHRPPSEPVVLTLAERCLLSRLFFWHNKIKPTYVKTGTQTSCRLSRRRNPSASNCVLGSPYTSPSSSISSASGSASCAASLGALFPLQPR